VFSVQPIEGRAGGGHLPWVSIHQTYKAKGGGGEIVDYKVDEEKRKDRRINGAGIRGKDLRVGKQHGALVQNLGYHAGQGGGFGMNNANVNRKGTSEGSKNEMKSGGVRSLFSVEGEEKNDQSMGLGAKS